MRPPGPVDTRLTPSIEAADLAVLFQAPRRSPSMGRTGGLGRPLTYLGLKPWAARVIAEQLEEDYGISN